MRTPNEIEILVSGIQDLRTFASKAAGAGFDVQYTLGEVEADAGPAEEPGGLQLGFSGRSLKETVQALEAVFGQDQLR